MTVRRALLAVFISAQSVVLGPLAATPQEPAPVGTEGTQSQPLSRQQINDRFLQRAMASIAGREHEPAARVFKNIRLEVFKGIPAENLLDIMNGGYSRALDVTCTHCHVEEDFSSDEKRPKRAARAMAGMHRRINLELARMEDLESEPEDRFINCGTCHRGSLRPQKPPR